MFKVPIDNNKNTFVQKSITKNNTLTNCGYEFYDYSDYYTLFSVSYNLLVSTNTIVCCLICIYIFYLN